MSRSQRPKTILTVVGARPQFIKAAPVSRAIKAQSSLREVLVHTGQHYDFNMSDIFFAELEIPKPDFQLEIGSGLQGDQTARMLSAIERTLLDVRPDLVMVYGDTNSTLAGALAAAKLHIPIAHVEAGLRSFNRRMPEEINRVLTDHLSDMLFVPTETAKGNLVKEGVGSHAIRVVGDVMLDASRFYAEKSARTSQAMAKLNLKPKSFVLATIHRAENTDNAKRLESLLGGLILVSKEIEVVLPLHPRTRRQLESNHTTLLSALERDLVVTEPLGYLDMILLEQNAAVIATDSGGVQKEAFFYRVPCVTLRDETEWTELIELGWNQLLPAFTPESVASTVRAAIGSRGKSVNLYGDGNSAALIAAALTE